MTVEIPFSIEVFPARSSAAALALGHTVHRLAEAGASFVAVTSGADGSSAEESADLVDYVVAAVDVPVLAHVTTWGRSADELRDRIRELRDSGVTSILAVRGDPPRAREGEDAGDVTATDLVGIVRETFDEDPAASVVDIAVAAFPLGHPSGGGVERDLDLLLAKQEAGATRALTQVQFEPAAYTAYVARARARGITIPIVPGVLPVVTAGRLRRVCELTGSPVPGDLEAALEAAVTREEATQIGVDYAVAVARRLVEAGAPALHFYTLNSADPVLRVLAQFPSSVSSVSGDDIATTTHREFA